MVQSRPGQSQGQLGICPKPELPQTGGGDDVGLLLEECRLEYSKGEIMIECIKSLTHYKESLTLLGVLGKGRFITIFETRRG